MIAVAVSVAVKLTTGARRHTTKADLTRPGSGAPGEIRTPNLLIRSQMLYPLSYGCLLSVTASRRRTAP